MLRRSLHAALSLVAAAALVGAGLVGVATPAAAAGFTGSAQVVGASSTTVGATYTVTLDTTGLNPVPTDYELLWQRQPVGGGAITTITTQSGAPDPSGLTTLTYTTTAVDAQHYLLLTATFTSTVPEPDAVYVAYGQTTVFPGSGLRRWRSAR
ncbi:hypothetical protein [Cellulomonas soli]